MSELQPITVYVHAGGPNPFKVVIVLEELGLPYNAIPLTNAKEEWYVKINPNGRLPAIVDPNTDLTLWESGAIMEYLVETYDKEGKLKGETVNDNWHIKQYLHFQMSGQGPYFGQAMWFHLYHSEDLPSAKSRYEDQAMRVFEVLNNILEGKEYLVGGKVTYADLSFITWSGTMLLESRFISDKIKARYDVPKLYPNFYSWWLRLNERPAVKRALKGTPYEI